MFFHEANLTGEKAFGHIDFSSKRCYNFGVSFLGVDMDSTTAFWMAQGISVFTGILAIIMMQFKNMKTILLFQIIVNATASLNYFLLGGDSGAIVSALAIIQSVVMFFYNTKERKPHIPVIIGFIACYVGVSLFNIIVSGDPMEIFPALAAVCFSLSLVQTKPSAFRIWGSFNPACWLVYDFYTTSYVMFCVHFCILISSLVAMIRIDGTFKRQKNNNCD